MSRPHRQESPDRLYVITGGRSQGADSALDPVTLIVSESAPAPGMQSEHAMILRMCQRPTAVVEIAAHLKLPVTVVRILLTDLIDTERSLRLELIIVLLIVFEIFLTFYQMFTGSGGH